MSEDFLAGQSCAPSNRTAIREWISRLQIPSRQAFVEVKNCHLVYADTRGYFPDAPSKRALRHLVELERAVGQGHLGVVIFVVQRVDVTSVRPSDLHDPAFADGARRAHRAGVRFVALRVRPSLEGYTVEGFVPVDLAPYSLSRVRSREAKDNSKSSRRGACGAPILSR